MNKKYQAASILSIILVIFFTGCNIFNKTKNESLDSAGGKPMIFDIKSSYNFEILSFFNVLTQDEYYVRLNREAYDKFFPLLSEQNKEMLSSMVSILHRTNIAFSLNLLLAQISGYEENSIAESFSKKEEITVIVEQLKQMPYIPVEYLEQIDSILDISIEIINDLERNGFAEYWQQEIKPSIDLLCKENQELLEQNVFTNIFLQYKPSLPKKINIYICAFHRPHGTKLTLNGDAMILSDEYSSQNRTLMVIAHEMFHPPYDYQKARQSLEKLSTLPFVIDAFNNQNENVKYAQMDYFFEENIVEALGIYVVYMLGIEQDPHTYFKNHDYGSHVISPLFFDYLLETHKKRDETFEQYLYNFVCTL
jgi:hypothetical protein